MKTGYPHFQLGLAKRKVEGRKGMVYVEEDWVDEEMTGYREADE